MPSEIKLENSYPQSSFLTSVPMGCKHETINYSEAQEKHGVCAMRSCNNKRTTKEGGGGAGRMERQDTDTGNVDYSRPVPLESYGSRNTTLPQ